MWRLFEKAQTGGTCAVQGATGRTPVTRDQIEALFAEEFGKPPLRCTHRKCTRCVLKDGLAALRGKPARRKPCKAL